jgi:imidazolonepropionase-like amidohydrolase
VILLKNATLIDGTGRSPLSKAVIGLEGQRIKLVGTEAELGSRQADFETVLDLEGKTVIPGLINTHEHLMLKRQYGSYQTRLASTSHTLLLRCVRSALLCLREGVTTIRDVGAIHFANIAVRDAINSGMIVGPRVYTCGTSLAMTGGHGYQNSVEVDGPEEARKAARQQLKAGADLVKVKASGGMVRLDEVVERAELTVEEMRPAIEEAHRAGKLTTSHAHGDLPVSNSMEAGVDCIEHGMHLHPPVAEIMVRQGVWLVPTLSQSTETFDCGAEWGKPQWLVEASRAGWPRRWEEFLAVVKTGVKLGVGTDGFGLMKREMELLSEAGLGNMGALVAATAGNAELLGRKDELGTVDPGKYADLVVLEGDPLADLKALGRVYLTIKDGVVYDPRQLAMATGALQPLVPSELGDSGQMLRDAPRAPWGTFVEKGE